MTELTTECIYKIINGVIPKEEHKGKHKFFKKHATHLFLQIFYSYTDNTEIKGFFACLKDKHEKNILGLGNMEIRNALSKVKMFSFKLAIVTENGSKQKERQICKFSD